MAALTAAMAGLAAGKGLMDYASSYSSAQDAKATADFNAKTLEGNAQIAGIQADDATRRGEVAANQQNARTRQTVGAQRAAMAAQGIDVNSGSAAEVQEDTKTMGALDALTIKNNAWREAWGYKSQATDLESKAILTRAGGDNSARTTLLGGGLKAISGMGSAAYLMGSNFSGFKVGGGGGLGMGNSAGNADFDASGLA